jgi:hypothetical protein
MKYALIIGNDRYTDPKLAQLKTPAADSQALARVLKDSSIGAFDEVIPLVNKTEFQVSRAISTFLTNKKPEDLILIYFSGHGILDDRGRLFLALKDTQTNLLKSTAIPSSFIADEMDSCRSKRQILILDCCNSGAFERGVKGQQKAVTEATFEGNGFGRVVLTASDATQFALEGNQIIQTEFSLFTHFLLRGLKTGEADLNYDGYVSLDEWYDYAYTIVLTITPKQTPNKWSYRQRGDLIIARNPAWKKVVELPTELMGLLRNPYPRARETAVKELRDLLNSDDFELAEIARTALEGLKEDSNPTVVLAAAKILSDIEKSVEEPDAGRPASLQKEEVEGIEKQERETVEKAEPEELTQAVQESIKREEAEKIAPEKIVQEAAEKAVGRPKREIEQKNESGQQVGAPNLKTENPQGEKRKALSKPNRTIIFLLIGLAGIACVASFFPSLVSNWVAFLTTATATATFTATISPPSTLTLESNLCASGEIEAQVEKVHRHMREFDDAAAVASNATQGELNGPIAELQRIRREAEDEQIPNCLTDLKKYQIDHMNTVITTLFEFKSASNPQVFDCTTIDSTEEESICGHIALAREQHDQYLLELARLLGLTVVPATAVDTPTP